MRRRRRWLFPLLLLAITAVLLWFIFRPRATQATFGPALALCPGPDNYGYTCTDGGGFAYIDATNDSQLYLLDGAVALPLPFPFTFYGTTYTELQASSNGNVQFGNANPNFIHECLDQRPASQMGDMIAPFWTDLDLTFAGALEHETVGEAPNRIFVVEWDSVPPFGSLPDNSVTFEVQLFEGSNDIVFLYEDVTLLDNVGNGRFATIGLQSENQGVALQFGCNQASVNDASRLHIVHPAQANEELGQTAVVSPYAPNTASQLPTPRGVTATLLEQLDLHGTAVLPALQQRWLNENPARLTEWVWLDMDGNGRSDLAMLWRGDQQHPELAQIALVSSDDAGRFQLRFDQRLSTRDAQFAQLELVETADLTADGHPDLLLHDAESGQLWLLTAVSHPQLHPIPDQCHGSLGLLDLDGDQQLEIVRDGCPTPGRLSHEWNGTTFQIISP